MILPPKKHEEASRLEAETGLAPVPPLGVVAVVVMLARVFSKLCRRVSLELGIVPDSVTGAQTDPLGNGTVLLLGLGKLLLGLEGLLALFGRCG